MFEQTQRPDEVVVVDNASTDNTREILERYKGAIRVIENSRNIGFAAGQNQAIGATGGEWALVLNPDATLEPGFIEELVRAAHLDLRVGSVCGLLRWISRDLTPLKEPMIDSAGIYFTPAMRHFDRGWHEPDDGRFGQMEYVFGASAAAALYRREMIEDISIDGEFFDPAFFCYREDADVAWRAQLLGWRCLYVPGAIGYHVRSVGPGNRWATPAILNMHSVKNRFLMRIKNASGDLYRRFWAQATARDLLVVAGCLLWERKSLPAFWGVLKGLPRALEQRRQILARRRASDESIAAWFRAEPTARPVREVAAPAMQTR